MLTAGQQLRCPILMHLGTGAPLSCTSLQRTDYLKNFWEWYIVYMKHCMNCSFTGGGRVDGRANLWVTSIRYGLNPS